MHTKKTAKKLLNKNAKNWIIDLIEDATKKQIRDIRPEPTEKNHWLYFKNLNKWIGICECSENKIYLFEIFENKHPEINSWQILLEEKNNENWIQFNRIEFNRK